MSNRFGLRYGKGTLDIDVGSGFAFTEIRKPLMPILEDPQTAVQDALENPVCCPPFSDSARNATTACIAICDITRPVPNHLFLRPTIEILMRSGIASENITVLIATGLHRPNLGDELEELIGDPWVLENVRVENHLARNDEDHVDLGRTKTRGTVVRLDRRFVEADIRIATGLVEPHFMAGYSGGRKVIAPGLAHAETITTFHSARFMADPAARNCNFDGNPLHEEQLEIIEMLGGALAINTVIDEHRQLSMINFGEILRSHELAVSFAREFCEVTVDRKFRTIVTSAAGYPLDKTYYQTIKAMVGAIDILQPGGDLIIASQCSEGFGSTEFLEAQKRLVKAGCDAFLKEILKKSHADIDEWQTQMQLAPMQLGNIYLFSELSESDMRWTGVEHISSVDKAIQQSISRQGDDHIAIIPEGPYVVPRSTVVSH